MAIYIPKIIKVITNPSTFDPLAGDLLHISKKMYRNTILLSRYNPQFPKANVWGGPEAYEAEISTVSHEGQSEGLRRAYKYGTPAKEPIRTGMNDYKFEPKGEREIREGTFQKDYIAIVDIDAVPHKYIKLPFVPRELNYEPQSNFVGIASFGRNNPYYQYLGSEDTLSFEIDWHSTENHREDVLYNCRWLEALTKGNGYNSRPHRCMIVWGGGIGENADNKLFGENNKWLLVAAPYTLTQFNRGYMDKQSGEYVNTFMLPQQAAQKVTFKRVAESNLTTEEIIGNLIPTEQYKDKD